MEATIKLLGINFEVEFDYTEEEAPVYNYGDGSGYPGCGEEISPYKMTFKGADFTEFLEHFEDDVIHLISKEKKDYCPC